MARLVGAILAALMLLATPVMAATSADIPPAGYAVVVFGLSDGTNIHPVASALLPPGALCQ